MLVEALLEEFSLDPVGPEPVRLVGGCRPRCLFPVDLDGLAALEIMRILGKGLVLGNTLINPLSESRENLTGALRSPLGICEDRVGAKRFMNSFTSSWVK